MKSYVIWYFDRLNAYSHCYVKADSLEEAIKIFEKTFDVDEENPIPKHYKVYELVFSSELVFSK